MVIDPEPLVTVMPDPAVSVAFVRVLPVLLPMSSCPSVYVVWPVPPWATVTAEPEVRIVPVVAGSVSVLVPATAGAATVIAPLVSPEITIDDIVAP